MNDHLYIGAVTNETNLPRLSYYMNGVMTEVNDIGRFAITLGTNSAIELHLPVHKELSIGLARTNTIDSSRNRNSNMAEYLAYHEPYVFSYSGICSLQPTCYHINLRAHPNLLPLDVLTELKRLSDQGGILREDKDIFYLEHHLKRLVYLLFIRTPYQAEDDFSKALYFYLETIVPFRPQQSAGNLG